jgi:hypothetical protein
VKPFPAPLRFPIICFRRSADPPIRRSADPPIRRSADPPIRRSADPPIRRLSIHVPTMNRIRIALAALALVAAPLAAQEEATDTVQLRFGWQPGMRAEVEMEQLRIRTTDGRVDSTRIASTYRLEVDEHPEGLALTYSDMRYTGLPKSADPQLRRLLEALAGSSSGGRGRSIVSREGDFVRVEGAEELAREVMAALEPLFAEMDGAGLENVRQMLAGMVSPEALDASAADEWNALVGAWIDADLEVGGVYGLESSFQSPAFPGVEIPVTLEFQVEGWTPCVDGAAEGAEPCVALVMISLPDPRAVGEAVGGFLAQAGVPREEMEGLFAQLAVETFITLVAEPATLRPHRLEIQRVVSAGDEADAPAQTDTRVFTYRYLP